MLNVLILSAFKSELILHYVFHKWPLDITLYWKRICSWTMWGYLIQTYIAHHFFILGTQHFLYVCDIQRHFIFTRVKLFLLSSVCNYFTCLFFHQEIQFQICEKDCTVSSIHLGLILSYLLKKIHLLCIYCKDKWLQESQLRELCPVAWQVECRTDALNATECTRDRRGW